MDDRGNMNEKENIREIPGPSSVGGKYNELVFYL